MRKYKKMRKFLLILLLFLPSLLFAKEEDLDSLWKKLEKTKNDIILYQNELLELEKEFEKVSISKEEIEYRLKKLHEQLEKLAKKEEESNQLLQKKKEERNQLINSLYILSRRNPLIFVLFSSDSFSDFLSKIQYSKNLIKDKLKKIKKLSMKLKELKEEIELTNFTRNSLQEEISLLEEKKKQIQLARIKTQEKLLSAKQEQKFIEEEILKLQGAQVKNNREFIKNNFIDFTKTQSIIIQGSGTGHGVGLSQYGAKGAALAGLSYKEILKHFYQGVEIKKIDTSKIKIRIKITRNVNLPELFYRGEIKYENGIIINELPLEDYLLGVVPCEMSYKWPKEALKAQAVAARTYAIYQLKPNKLYDLTDTPFHQAYLGKLKERKSTTEAVRETEGEVLTYNGKIIAAYYFSTSGGWTENNENVWGTKPKPYLKGVKSFDETSSPYWYWETEPLSKAFIENALNSFSKTKIGNLRSIEIIKRGVSGRVMAIKIKGSLGEKTITGRTFKFLINSNLSRKRIRSTLFGFKAM